MNQPLFSISKTDQFVLNQSLDNKEMIDFKYVPVDKDRDNSDLFFLRCQRYQSQKGICFLVYSIVIFLNPLEPIFLLSWNLVMLALHSFHRQGLKSTDFYLLISSLLFGAFEMFEYQTVLLSLLCFTFKFSLQIQKQCIYVMEKIKTLSITIIFTFCLFAYLFTFLFNDRKNVAKYFKNYGLTSVTLLQVLTLDGWGEIGRGLEKDQTHGYNGLGCFLLCLFIFLMTYFYMNIMVGLVLETMQNYEERKDDQPKELMASQFEQSDTPLLRSSQLSLFDEILLGKYYQFCVFVLSFGTVTITVYHGFQPFDWELEIFFASLDDVIFTLHFIFILGMEGRLYSFERQSQIMMGAHFLAGPMSLFCTIFYDQSISSLLNLLKLATTPMIKGVFKGTFHITPFLIDSFIMLIASTLFFSALSTQQYNNYHGAKGEEYFSTIWWTFYTYFQVLTLDDWNAAILPIFKNDRILPYLLFVFYIYFSNFILLNTMIAISCEYFTEVEMGRVQKNHHHQRRNRMECSIQDVLTLCSIKQREYVKVYFLPTYKCLTQQEQAIVDYVKKHQITSIQIKYKGQVTKTNIPTLLRN